MTLRPCFAFLEDLLQGTRVTVIGQREDGSVEASSIILLPEDGQGFFGGGPGGDRLFIGDRPAIIQGTP